MTAEQVHARTDRRDAADPSSPSPTPAKATGSAPADPSPTEAKPRRYRGQDPEQRRAERRRRLLDAGLELFGTVGYQSTSVERLCSTSGVTGRHFYEEFPSREALLGAVLDDILADCLTKVAAALGTAPPDLEDRLTSGIGAYVRGLSDDPRRARIVALEVVGVSPAFEEHRRGLGRAFADMVRDQARELIATGAPLQGNDLTLQALLAVIHELTMVYLTADEPFAVQDVIDEAVRIVMAVALAPAR